MKYRVKSFTLKLCSRVAECQRNSMCGWNYRVQDSGGSWERGRETESEKGR